MSPRGRDASAEALAEAAGVPLDLLRAVFPGRVVRFVPTAAAAATEDADAEDATTEAAADVASPEDADAEDVAAEEARLLAAASGDPATNPRADDPDEHPAHGGPR